MPYLVKVGAEKSRTYGLTSQAYFIRRQGKKVITRWGAIEVVHGHRIKLRWKWSKLQEKKYPCSSVADAIKFKDDKINYFIDRSFTVLKSDAKIYPRLK